MPRADATKPGMYDINATAPAPTETAARVAAAKAGERRRARSIIGAALRRSTTTKTHVASTATPTSTATTGCIQPCRPSTRAASNAATATAKIRAPAMSSPRGVSDRESGTTFSATSARTTEAAASTQ